MATAKILGDIKKIDKDVEVCRTTNQLISKRAAELLIENQIPFSRDWVKIPFFQREKYRGARKFYVIRTNRNRYSQARRTIDTMEPACKRKLFFCGYSSVNYRSRIR